MKKLVLVTFLLFPNVALAQLPIPDICQQRAQKQKLERQLAQVQHYIQQLSPQQQQQQLPDLSNLSVRDRFIAEVKALPVLESAATSAKEARAKIAKAKFLKQLSQRETLLKRELAKYK